MAYRRIPIFIRTCECQWLSKKSYDALYLINYSRVPLKMYMSLAITHFCNRNLEINQILRDYGIRTDGTIEGI